MANILYMRSVQYNSDSLFCQEQMAKRYCEDNNITVDRVLTDVGYMTQRKQSETIKLSTIGYSPAYQGEKSYSSLDNLLLMIAGGEVDMLLVDFKQRLRTREHTDSFLFRLCYEHDVEIVEYGTFLPDNDPCDNRIIIYHDTNVSQQRVKYMLNDVDELYHAVRLRGRTVDAIFLDETRTEMHREKFLWLKEHLQSGDVLVIKSLLNLSVKLVHATDSIVYLTGKNVKIYTLSDGYISLKYDSKPHELNLNAVTYDSFADTQDKYDKLLERIDLYIKLRTRWNKAGDYYEGIRALTVKQFTVLEDMIKNQEKYDLIVVTSFKRLNRNTCRFVRILKELDKDKIIYSIEEGGYINGLKR